ncbi:translation initiation factor 3 [Streptomyces sp. NL15-2K]|nr:translation initiation factor 3 [Streptomyces sp. NL15-2K]
MLGPQVEAPISHLTVLRDGGSPGQAATIVPYGRWSRPKARPAIIAAVLR